MPYNKLKKLLSLGHFSFSKNYTDPEEPRHAVIDRVKKNHHNNGAIRIVSYNIRFARKVEKAIQVVQESHNLHNADIICLQEMDHDGVEMIANELDYNYIYYPAVLHPQHQKDFGNAILTKWPILEDEKIIMPVTREEQLQRIAVRAKINIKDKEINIICLHLDIFMGPSKRSQQILNLIQKIPSSVENCIVAGDFNTFTKKSRRAILNPFMDAGFTLATEDVGWTFRHWYLLYKKQHLDHIYIRGLKIMDQGKVINNSASDHIPIWATLK